MPEVSFVAPVYNKAAWITDTIISLQRQTLKDIEIIFIDDGSTDGTPDVIEHFMKEDKRIRLYKLGKNYGLGKAWNYGTKKIKSPILAVASGDDVWVKERAKWTRDFFHKNPLKDVYYGGFYFCDSVMNPIEHKPAIPFSAKKMLEPRKDGYCPQYIGHFTMALRAKVAFSVPYRGNLKVGVDYPFLCDLIASGAQFGWTSKTLGYARILKSGVSISRREEVVKASA